MSKARPRKRLLAILALGTVLILAGAAANVLQSDWYVERKLASTPVDELGRTVVRNPTDYRAQYHLGVKLEAAGRVEDALLAYSTAIRVRPDDPRSWKRMARILLDRQDAETADGLLQSAVQRFPNDAELRKSHALALEQLGAPDQAAAEQQQGISFLPPAKVTAADWVTLGRYQFLARQYEPAVESCRKGIALRPDEPDAQRGLGAALLLEGKSQDAVPPLELATRQNPTDAQAQYFLGRALLSSAAAADRDRGAASLREAIRLSPQHSRAWYWLGSYYSRRGEWSEVAKAEESAVRWDPFLAEAHQAAALAYRKLGQVEKARRADLFYTHLQEAAGKAARLEPRVAADPDNPALLQQMGDLYKALGRRVDARRIYRHLLQIRPDDPLAKRSLAESEGKREALEKK